MLSVQALNQFYRESHTLWDLDLEIPAGQCTCIMGRNGVGKTTLLKCIMGLLPIKSGRIEFEQHNLLKKPADYRANIGIGYVPQGREIFSQLSVEENLKIGLIPRADKCKHIPAWIYDMFPVLLEMKNRRGGDLSGGQQQQLAIGRALVIDPKVLILDEPTEGIQPNIVQEIGHVINVLNQEQNITVVLVEQKLPFARKVADQFALIDKGRSVASGKMAELSEALIEEYLTV